MKLNETTYMPLLILHEWDFDDELIKRLVDIGYDDFTLNRENKDDNVLITSPIDWAAWDMRLQPGEDTVPGLFNDSEEGLIADNEKYGTYKDYVDCGTDKEKFLELASQISVMNKLIEDIRQTHDRVKESPYWLNFNNEFRGEVRKQMNDLVDLSIRFVTLNSVKQAEGIGQLYRDKYSPLIKTFWHDVRRYLGCNYEPRTEKFENAIFYLQGFLSVIHQMLDNIDEAVYAADNSIWRNKIKSELYDKDKCYGYYAYNEIPKEDKPKLIKWLKSYQESAYDKEVIQKLINDVEKEISPHYKFV